VSAESNTDGIAPATDTTGRPAAPGAYVEEVRPIIMWDKDFTEPDDELYDFRPRAEKLEDAVPEIEEEEPDPKALSALASALAANYETYKTPDVGSSPSPESSASADKGSTPPSQSESGTQTSSSKTSAGKTVEPAET